MLQVTQALSVAGLIGTFLFAFFGITFWMPLPMAETVAARGYILIALMAAVVLAYPIYSMLMALTFWKEWGKDGN